MTCEKCGHEEWQHMGTGNACNTLIAVNMRCSCNRFVPALTNEGRFQGHKHHDQECYDEACGRRVLSAPSLPSPASSSPGRLAIIFGYEQLAKVLDDALAQAQAGKGKERHAGEGEAFHDQQIVQLCEWIGSNHGDIFQAVKKAIESVRLPPDRAEAELLGAINYLAAAVLVLRRRPDQNK